MSSSSSSYMRDRTITSVVDSAIWVKMGNTALSTRVQQLLLLLLLVPSRVSSGSVRLGLLAGGNGSTPVTTEWMEIGTGSSSSSLGGRTTGRVRMGATTGEADDNGEKKSVGVRFRWGRAVVGSVVLATII